MKLFICGNGFDMHHNLRTGYDSYREFLKTQYHQVYRQYEDFPYLFLPFIPGKEYTPWTNVEQSLTIEYRELMENAVSQDYPNLLSDSDSRWSDMEVNVDILTEFLDSFTGKCFYEWISSIDCSHTVPDLNLALDALYVTFNYTDTLQVLYGIPESNILHIHGSLNRINPQYITNDTVRAEIQFGSPELNADQAYRELERQYGDDDFYGASISLAVSTLCKALQRSSKDLVVNYARLNEFLAHHEINEVIIMGHTLTGADFPYYSDVILPKCHSALWTFMCYDNEKDIEQFLAIANVSRYRIRKW